MTKFLFHVRYPGLRPKALLLLQITVYGRPFRCSDVLMIIPPDRSNIMLLAGFAGQAVFRPDAEPTMIMIGFESQLNEKISEL